MTAPREVQYKRFVLQARPPPRPDGTWGIEERIINVDVVRPFYASNSCPSEDEAVRLSLDFGKKIIDGEIPGISTNDSP